MTEVHNTWAGKISRYFRISRLRIFVQAGFTLYCLYAGYRFYRFYLWTMHEAETYVSRPPSVEAFLPISAFLGLKRLVLTGQWDPVHPAGLTVFLAAIFIAFLLRKGFCGWICPAGFVSNLLEKIGKPIRVANRLPKGLDYPLLALKYLLLAFFLYVILLKMDLGAIEAFLYSPYNLAADAKMLQFFLHITPLALAVIGALLLVSLVVRNFWCRYLCPYGALLGLLAVSSPIRVRRNASRCIDCRKCEEICPASLRIAGAETVRQAECIGCMECIGVCPEKNCLTLQIPRKKQIPILAMPLAVIGVFGVFYTVAALTGHWHTAVPPDLLKRLYQSASSFAHP
jgi:polyferredoxin